MEWPPPSAPRETHSRLHQLFKLNLKTFFFQHSRAAMSSLCAATFLSSTSGLCYPPFLHLRSLLSSFPPSQVPFVILLSSTSGLCYPPFLHLRSLFKLSSFPPPQVSVCYPPFLHLRSLLSLLSSTSGLCYSPFIHLRFCLLSSLPPPQVSV